MFFIAILVTVLTAFGVSPCVNGEIPVDECAHPLTLHWVEFPFTVVDVEAR